MLRTTLFALALGIAAGLAPSSQAAGPAGPSSIPSADMGLVQPVHGCHRACERGPRGGWHYHVGPNCRRVDCSANPGGGHIWRCDGGRCGWWHPRQKRWH